LTVSASARRTLPPASIASFRSSTRLTPEAMTMTGAPSMVKTSDFAICPTPTPTASAACWEVRASTGSSSTARPSQMASSAAWTRAAAGFTAA
jgi:hypothetical protein